MVVEGSTVPAATCEEIALFAVDTNATVDALGLAIETIEAEYKKIISPEAASDETTPKPLARKSYG